VGGRLTEHVHRFACFGTTVTVVIGCDRSDLLHAGLLALGVQARLQSLHRTLTRFDAGSELCALNARPGVERAVSSDLYAAVDVAVAAAARSGGLVDPTILPALERAGYGGSRAGTRPAPLEAALDHAPERRPAAPRTEAEWSSIEFAAERRAVRLPRGVRLDLGGTAKGLAVDVAAEMLAGEAMFAVDAGGDLRVGGTAGVAREIRVDHPLGGVVAPLTLAAGAIATSGLRTRVWRQGDGYAHHLVDPAREEPAWTGVIQATAYAPTAVEAERLAKVALLSGPDGGRRALARHGGLLVTDAGAVVEIMPSACRGAATSDPAGTAC
jgi:thiamine biosynthesis lipoprotein